MLPATTADCSYMSLRNIADFKPQKSAPASLSSNQSRLVHTEIAELALCASREPPSTGEGSAESLENETPRLKRRSDALPAIE